MTFSAVFRPVCVTLVGLSAAACSMADNDPDRFQNMAEQVAAIPVEGGDFAQRRVLNAQDEGLRPAMRVEVLDPHAFWDARDGLRHAIETATVVENEASAMVEAVSDVAPALVPERARPAPVIATVPLQGETTTIQLGAYSSEAGARAAWARLSEGSARAALAGYAPTYEAVTVGGKPFTRLKVGPAPVEAAAAICRAAQVSDPWCLRRG